MSISNPKLVLLFSGKRKCGKDYLTDKLFSKLNDETSVIIKISAPIKSKYAQIHNLDLNNLMSSGNYKETYRSDMIEWSEKQRDKDPGVFCREAVKLYKADSKKIWIVSDIRRKSDIAWFLAMFDDAVKTVRVVANEETRIKRGWEFTTGVDDNPSECDLDNVSCWDWTISNNDGEDCSAVFDEVIKTAQNCLQ